MQALILVGGKGTRLRPLTSEIPKPIVPLVDRPFISHMIEWLGSHGVDDVVLACGFLPDQMKEVLGEGEPGGPRLRYVTEPEALDTAGAIKFAEEHLEDRFFALNGDVLTDLDLTALLRSHEEHGYRASLGLYPVEDPTGYGLVELNEENCVTAFHEKPEPGHAGPGLINAGTYVLDKEVLRSIPAGRKVSIEREVFPKLIGEGLGGMRLEGYWMDIGTPDRYLQASWDILEGKVKTLVRPSEPGLLVSADASVDAGAEVGPRAVISPDCQVDAGARVQGSVLLAGCRVGEGAVVEDTILSRGVEVAPGAVLREEVIGQDERVDA